MAITNQERIGKAMDALRAGLAPFVERDVPSAVKPGSLRMDAVRRFAEDPMLGQKPIAQWDAAGLLTLMWETWNDVFGRTLGRAERSLVQELREWRNKWAHQEPFSGDDADRALDSMARLLSAMSAPQADDVQKMKVELRRLIFDEQVRGEKRKAGGSLIEAAATGALRPWREVVTPHPDVASGRYQQAELAADLWQVHLGEGSDEYCKPEEFFRRTFLTESLKRLLVSGVQRIAATGGDPVVQLQTNFGGGKTHSMLALYHLSSGAAPSELAGFDTVLAQAGVKALPKARRGVLVGNKSSPGNPITKGDGTVVRTLWGELAYQLGGKKAFARVAQDDERATSSADVLRELFVEYGPCLVLVDGWVAYARQLHDQGDLPGGSFETLFTSARALTESARLAKSCLLVISPPPSDTAGSPLATSDDVEVGGVRGWEALDRLRNDGPRVWYATQPTVTKLAEDRAEQLKRDPDKVTAELDTRVCADLRRSGDFSRAHPLPRSGADVPDDLDARLVVLPPEHPYSKEPGNAAEAAAKAILESRGNTPRLYRNTVIFLAADRVRLQDLDEALRKFLAWSSLVAEKETLNLNPHQVRQAQRQQQAADDAVNARLPETSQWVLVPEQKTPQAPVEWQAIRLSGADALAVRASRKLRSDELLFASLGSTILRKHLVEVPLWRGEHVAVKQLVEDFARYLYLPRLAGPDALLRAIRDGVALLTWQTDTFAYAESRDEASGRYRGLRSGQVVSLSADGAGLLVRPEIARRQLDAEVPPPSAPGGAGTGAAGGGATRGKAGPAVTGAEGETRPTVRAAPQRFHGTVDLDPARVGRDASRIADEVIVHRCGLVGAEVRVTSRSKAGFPTGRRITSCEPSRKTAARCGSPVRASRASEMAAAEETHT